MTRIRCRAKAIVAESGLSMTKAEDKEVLNVIFEAMDGGLKGQKFVWNAYFTEAAIERTLNSLKIMGWTGIDPSDLRGIDRNIVQIVIDEEEYEGEIRQKVSWVNEDRAFKSVSTDKAKEIGKTLQEKIKAFKSKGNDSDVPF